MLYGTSSTNIGQMGLEKKEMALKSYAMLRVLTGSVTVYWLDSSSLWLIWQHNGSPTNPAQPSEAESSAIFGELSVVLWGVFKGPRLLAKAVSPPL